jgi:hypothetical protein
MDPPYVRITKNVITGFAALTATEELATLGFQEE